MIVEIVGNIFTTKSQTIVNTVNCVGVMGAGLAYEFRLREKDMFEKYKILCKEKKIDIGKLWIYKSEKYNILNFPTKYDWKFPSKKEYLEKGLQKFLSSYKQKNITSIAFPLLGADKGGLSKNISLEIMHRYLSQCDIDIEIWHFDPNAKDEIYEDFKKSFLAINNNIIKKELQIRADTIKKIHKALKNEHINSLSGLLTEKGIGEKTVEKLFRYMHNHASSDLNLFSINDILL